MTYAGPWVTIRRVEQSPSGRGSPYPDGDQAPARGWPLAPIGAVGGLTVAVVLLAVGVDPARVLPLALLTLGVVAVLGAEEWRSRVAAQRARQAAVREMVAAQREALERMQDTERLKDNLLSVVSHEFRTPLTAIIGFSQTVRRMAESGPMAADAVRLSADRIERNGLRLSRLIGNMLAATTDVQPDPGRYYPLRETIDAIVVELSGAVDTDIPVEVEVPHDLTARMSREHLRLLLGNLIDNGMKFAEEGTALSIKGRVAGDEVALTFTNFGPEIPEAMHEQIFARFVQVDLSDTRPYDGVGLGLHVVRKLCDAHGGGLAVRCQDGLVVLGVTVPAGPRASVGLAGQTDADLTGGAP